MDQIIRRYPAPISQAVALTGYRPQKMPFGFNERDKRCLDFKRRLYNTLEMMIFEGYTHFISGGALGMDMFAAEIILQLRSRYPNITLELAIPFDKQTEKWKQEYKDRAEVIRQQADIVTWVDHEYKPSCLFARNRYMVQHCSVVLAAYDGKPGGTAMTLDYARFMGKQITVVRPEVA